MQYLNLDIKNFGGINTALGSTMGVLPQVDGFDLGASKDGTTLFHGFITKYPALEALGDTIAASASRGLHLFLPSVSATAEAYRYLQAFSDGTVRYYNSTTGAWTSVTSSLPASLQHDFADYNYWDRVFYTNGRQAPRKWGRDWTAGCALQDKSGTAVALTGIATFTENETKVTGVSTTFDTELYEGAWIRKESADDWYEVTSIVDAAEVLINNPYVGTTGDGGDGNSQKAATSAIRARFVENWNDRLFWASGDTSALPIVGVALVGDVGTPLP